MTEEKETTVWGQPLESKKVHLYINGYMPCDSKARGVDYADGLQPFDERDIDHPDNCPKCKAWARLIKKGLTVKTRHNGSQQLEARS